MRGHRSPRLARPLRVSCHPRNVDVRRGRFRRGLCGVCGDGPAHDCARCGVDLCTSHGHKDDERCILCEREYETSFAVKDGALYVFTMLASPSLLMLAVLGALSIPSVGLAVAVTITIVTLVGVAKGFPTARRLIATSSRSRFLAENALPDARLIDGRT